MEGRNQNNLKIQQEKRNGSSIQADCHEPPSFMKKIIEKDMLNKYDDCLHKIHDKEGNSIIDKVN